jgi:hypothetical protein
MGWTCRSSARYFSQGYRQFPDPYHFGAGGKLLAQVNHNGEGPVIETGIAGITEIAIVDRANGFCGPEIPRAVDLRCIQGLRYPLHPEGVQLAAGIAIQFPGLIPNTGEDKTGLCIALEEDLSVYIAHEAHRPDPDNGNIREGLAAGAVGHYNRPSQGLGDAPEVQACKAAQKEDSKRHFSVGVSVTRDAPHRSEISGGVSRAGAPRPV